MQENDGMGDGELVWESKNGTKRDNSKIDQHGGISAWHVFFFSFSVCFWDVYFLPFFFLCIFNTPFGAAAPFALWSFVLERMGVPSDSNSQNQCTNFFHIFNSGKISYYVTKVSSIFRHSWGYHICIVLDYGSACLTNEVNERPTSHGISWPVVWSSRVVTVKKSNKKLASYIRNML